MLIRKDKRMLKERRGKEELEKERQRKPIYLLFSFRFLSFFFLLFHLSFVFPFQHSRSGFLTLGFWFILCCLSLLTPVFILYLLGVRRRQR